jgi:hypothetical protein
MLPNLELPLEVRTVLEGFLKTAIATIGDDLSAAVLFGSAAEGKLRATSDVNLLIVLKQFVPEEIEALGPAMRSAHAAIGLNCMLLLDSEIQIASSVFAVKFSDIARRRAVIYGKDPFEGMKLSREALVSRLRQVLLNQTLRLRAAFAMRSNSGVLLTSLLADSAGPLRTCAAALLELQGKNPTSPKAALEEVVASLKNPRFANVLKHMSNAREDGNVQPDELRQDILDTIELARQMELASCALPL